MQRFVKTFVVCLGQRSNPNCKVTSFDIGLHKYVKFGKEYIDNEFPYRHTLILGNSLESVPKFSKENPGKLFNLIFVDGNHEYEYAYNDIINCKKLANENTILVVDDIVNKDKLQTIWSIGPSKAWNDIYKWKRLFMG